jgi:DNA repair exonuclease SbcCD nuclease subunit
VSAVIIAGDLFDTDRCSEKTKNVVLSKIAQSHGVDFLYLCGNHDAGKTLADEELPDNLKLFEQTWKHFTYGDVDVYGAVMTEDNCKGIYGGLVTDANRFNVVVMHGAKSQSSGDDLINLNELAEKNIDYLALGHYHSYESGALGRRGVWCYSGCLEGRGFDECGDKGFVLLEINNGKLQKQFIKTSKRKIVSVECDITDVADTGEMMNRINESVEEVDETSMVRLELVGDIPEDARKDIEFFNQSLNSRFYFAKTVDSTRVKICPEDYVNDISLKGEFIRRALSADMDENMRNRVIECGLAVLKGREVF